jgi:hypothetical protein
VQFFISFYVQGNTEHSTFIYRHGAPSGRELRRPADVNLSVNILNKQSQEAGKWWSSSVGLLVGITAPKHRGES